MDTPDLEAWSGILLIHKSLLDASNIVEEVPRDITLGRQVALHAINPGSVFSITYGPLPGDRNNPWKQSQE